MNLTPELQRQMRAQLLQNIAAQLADNLDTEGVIIAVFHKPENRGPNNERVEFVSAIREDELGKKSLPELMQKITDEVTGAFKRIEESDKHEP